MDFFTDILIISIVGGFVAFDTTAGWQTMFSQPLASCTAIGFILGNPSLGLMMGFLLQLPWLLEIPAGGALNSESNIGSFVSASLAISLLHNQVNSENILIVISILWGLAVGWVGARVVDSMRRSNNRIVHQAEKAAETGDASHITRLNMMGALYAYALGFCIVAFSYGLGRILLGKFGSFIPIYFDTAFGYAKIGVLALGVGSMISMFLSRRHAKYFVYGLIGSSIIYLIL